MHVLKRLQLLPEAKGHYGLYTYSRTGIRQFTAIFPLSGLVSVHVFMLLPCPNLAAACEAGLGFLQESHFNTPHILI